MIERTLSHLSPTQRTRVIPIAVDGASVHRHFVCVDQEYDWQQRSS
ncbi:hypothetical protein [Oligosphaera ethanolica]|uniref:Uncharacterized protein n=1 Tax=Oligosphaera ethanolica TaxID=760260 RepID=A0AAE3VI56_9BACT|nr:hypothetical protein [Oligosphaera ethanolica]MDQ0290894.1 hypothetical protein [Oligosphaera ethanolica]